jgi:hypothetical protein
MYEYKYRGRGKKVYSYWQKLGYRKSVTLYPLANIKRLKNLVTLPKIGDPFSLFTENR